MAMLTGSTSMAVERDALKEETARLRRLLRKYGCHLFTCAYTDTHGETDCDCGWRHLEISLSVDGE
jgi:hypothetical protein